MGYYYDYQAEIDDQIRQEQALAEASLAASPGPDPDLRRRIREARKAQ